MAQPEIADSETDGDILISQQFICKKWVPKYRIWKCGFHTNYSKAQVRKSGRGTCVLSQVFLVVFVHSKLSQPFLIAFSMD